MAYINVTAPSGANITATCDGLTLTGTGSCTFDVPIIGTWEITCSFDGVTKTETVAVDAYGETYAVSFTYVATITVSTFAGATVVATKSGESSLTGTADSNGECVLNTPPTGLGEWNVTATYDVWSNSTAVDVAAFDTDYPVEIPLSVPAFTFTANSTTYSFDENTATTSVADVYYYYRSGTDWELYGLTNGTLSFRGATKADVFLCGAGFQGATGTAAGPANGGYGGFRKTITDQVLSGSKPLVVGASNGSISALGSFTAADGTRATSNGENGGYSFDDPTAKGPDGNSRRVGAAGGRGANSYTDGTSQGSGKWAATSGGNYGGGNGGDSDIDGVQWYANPGSNGSYYGAGGGGGGYCAHYGGHPERNRAAAGGDGYKGFAAMRGSA